MEKYKNSENDSEIDRDHQAKTLIRLMKSATNIEGLSHKPAREVFDPDSEAERRDLIARLSDAEYSNLITGINGILRDKEKNTWEMDGDGVTAIRWLAMGLTEKK